MMPTRRTFLGLSTGAAVSLSITQAGNTDTGSTGSEGWGLPPAAGELTVSITALSPTDTRAPAGYTFIASVAETVPHAPAAGTYSPDTDLNFLLAETYWECDDGAASFGAPQNSPVAEFLRKDRGIGGHYCRVFDTPGTHTVTCRVYFPDGRWGTASTTVTVLPEDHGYDATNTVVVAPNGVFTDAPASNHQVTTLDAALTAVDGMAGTEARILFDPSQGVGIDARPNINTLTFTTVTNIRFGSWSYGTKAGFYIGTGSSPFSITPQGMSVKWVDIDIQSGWDARLEIGTMPGHFITWNTNGELLFHNCSDTGLKLLVFSNDDGPTSSLFVNDHARTDSQQYMVLVTKSSGVISITGTRHIDSDQAAGSRPKPGSSPALHQGNEHNGARVSAERVYFCHNEVGAYCGWSAGYEPTSNSWVRLGRANLSPAYSVVARNMIDGTVEKQLDNNRGLAKPHHVLIEQNYVVMQELFPRMIISDGGGLISIRNNVFLAHNVPIMDDAGATGNQLIAMADVELYQADLNTADEPIFIYGNAIVHLGDDINYDKTLNVALNRGDGFAHVEEANNIIHQPNLSAGTDWGLDATPLGYNANFPGLHVNFIRADVSFGTVTPPGGTITVPYAGNTLSYDGTQRGQADFAGVADNPDRHVLEMEETFTTAAGQVGLGFNGTNPITVTNSTGFTWATGAVIRIQASGVVAATLVADVAPGETVDVPNPNGYVPGGADSLRYSHDIGGANFTLTAEPAGITLTNPGPADWPAASIVRLVVDTGQSPIARQTRWAHPAGTISLYRPTAAIPADPGLVPLHDFTGSVRPGSPHPQAVSAALSKGALAP